MKVVIFAGGMGTRLMEETKLIPKPMVEIGGKPILWHILKIYSKQGFDEFIICCGYKGDVIKEYFINYMLINSDFSISTEDSKITIHKNHQDNFKLTFVDTGYHTNTAGRLKKIKPYLNSTFMLTYGDGVADVNLKELINFHKSHKKLVTLTAVKDRSRYGELHIDEIGIVNKFEEKPEGYEKFINGGFFVMEMGIFDFLQGDVENIQFEREPLGGVCAAQQLSAYKHLGFWQSMDSLRDKTKLDTIWNSNKAPWKIW